MIQYMQVTSPLGSLLSTYHLLHKPEVDGTMEFLKHLKELEKKFTCLGQPPELSWIDYLKNPDKPKGFQKNSR